MPSMGSLAEEGLALMEEVTAWCRMCGYHYPLERMHKLEEDSIYMRCDLCMNIDRDDESWY